MTGTFYIMIACLTWALDTLIRYPLLAKGYSTLNIVLLEHLTLVCLTLPILWRHRKALCSLNALSMGSLFFIGGIGSAIGTLAFTQAFHYLNPTVVILLQKLQPLVAILGAYYLLKETIHRYFLHWAAVILGGSLLMMWPDILSLNLGYHTESNTHDLLLGYGFTLLSVFAWGMATVCGRYLSQRNLPSNAILAGRFLFGLIVLLGVSVSQPDLITKLPTSDLGWIVIMALLSGLVGMWLYYLGLKSVPAHLATLVEMIFPIFAALINWAFLNMSLNRYQMVGGAILIIGNLGIRLYSSPQRQEHAAIA
jgi:drug/metabolite transporter (DMT)-like permease